jgi:excisionase family DNA binding protein
MSKTSEPKQSVSHPPGQSDDNQLQLLSPQQVAELLAVSRSTVDRMVASGRLPSIPITSGKRKTSYRIRRTALEEWISRAEIIGKQEGTSTKLS